MKHLLKVISGLFLLCVGFTSCTQTVYIQKKEFVIKQIDCTKKKNSCEYILFNTKNKKIVLEDNSNKYQIGDTLILARKQTY